MSLIFRRPRLKHFLYPTTRISVGSSLVAFKTLHTFSTSSSLKEGQKKVDSPSLLSRGSFLLTVSSSYLSAFSPSLITKRDRSKHVPKPKPPQVKLEHLEEGVTYVAPTYVKYKEIPVINLANEEVENIQILRSFVEAPIRTDILHRVVVWQLAKRRQGTHYAKNRAEVRGGGRKPWKQKGTGRARAGSIRSPLWKGGGVTFPPRQRDYYYPLPRKVRAFGLKSAVSARLAQGRLIVVSDFELENHKTKNLAEILKKNGWENALIVDDLLANKNLRLAGLSLPTCDIIHWKGLNVYSILLRDKLIITKSCLQSIEKRFIRLETNPFPLFHQPNGFLAKREQSNTTQQQEQPTSDKTQKQSQ
jgi:large subunit ribosomal protein L4